MIAEYGVTANMPALGAGDSGFESQYSDWFVGDIKFFKQN